MRDWNVVVTVHEGSYRRIADLLASFGRVARSDYFNVLVLRVEDMEGFLAAMQERVTEEPSILGELSRLVPVSVAFSFQSPAEFEAEAKEAAARWLPKLEHKSFHVRMHRRGFKGRLSSQEEERFLDFYLLQRLEEAGQPGRISFDDPDFIIALETVGQRAGLSFWPREVMARYPFLKLD